MRHAERIMEAKAVPRHVQSASEGTPGRRPHSRQEGCGRCRRLAPPARRAECWQVLQSAIANAKVKADAASEALEQT